MDKAEDEHSLGWPEDIEAECGGVYGVDDEGEPFLGWSEAQSESGEPPTGVEPGSGAAGPHLRFDGKGSREANRMLNGVGLPMVRIAPGWGDD